MNDQYYEQLEWLLIQNIARGSKSKRLSRVQRNQVRHVGRAYHLSSTPQLRVRACLYIPGIRPDDGVPVDNVFTEATFVTVTSDLGPKILCIISTQHLLVRNLSHPSLYTVAWKFGPWQNHGLGFDPTKKIV
jgi:hypothetical protein